MKPFTALAAALAAIWTLSTDAAASTIVQTFGISGSTTSASFFPVPFSTLSGTLQSVQLDFSGIATGHTTGFSDASGSVTIGTALNATVSFAGLQDIHLASTEFDSVGFLENQGFSLTAVAFDDAKVIYTEQNILDLFQTSMMGLMTDNSAPFCIGDCINIFGLNQDRTLTLNITYTYLPNTPVPEPTTWAMFIVGFGAMGAAMRRRPKTRLASA